MTKYYKTKSGKLITEKDILRAYEQVKDKFSYGHFLRGCGAVEVDPAVDELVKALMFGEAAKLFAKRYGCGLERAGHTVGMMRDALGV